MLTNLRVKRANCPQGKSQIKITDGRGLYLLVLAKGGKYWRFDYRYQKKRKTLALGVYPKISLAEARRLHIEACHSLELGIDPKLTLAQKNSQGHTFIELYREWLQHRDDELAVKTLKNIQSRMNRLVLPSIGEILVDELDSLTVLTLLRRIEAQGAIHTAHRVKSLIGQVIRYGIATGNAKQDPTPALHGVLKSDIPKPRPAIVDPKILSELMKSIDVYTGATPILHALQILSQVFVRPSELRLAKWNEIDMEMALWRIPESRMKVKGRGDHLVPLSSQVLGILKKRYVGLPHSDEFIFPGLRPGRPLSENTLNMALRSLGYDGNTHVAHGFRATARSLLSENGWPIPAIERQLAHAERDAIARAYSRSEYMDIRIQMMQAWSDYLQNIKTDTHFSLKYSP